MNSSRMDLHSFSRTSFCRMMAKIMVALMVFQTFPLWELSRSHQWSPEEFTRTVSHVMQLLGPGEAHAAAPVADAGGDRSLTKDRPGGRSVLLDGLASFDPDGDPLTYQWYGPFVTTSGPTPAVIIPEGTYSVSLAVDDGISRSPVDTSIVTIAPCFALTARAKSGKVQLVWTHQPGTDRYDIFRAGEAAPQSFQKIGETTSTYSTYLDATVVNETTYVYVVAAVSAGAACYSGFAGSHPTASRTASNYAPVITSSPVTVGTVGIPYNYQVLATDPNGDALHYSLLSAPAGMAIGPADGLISWVPIGKGTFEVVVKADDGRGKEITQTFTVTVVEATTPNRVPVAHAGPDQTVVVGSTATLDGGKSTDADGDPLTYFWTLDSSPAGSTAALSDPTLMKPTFFVDKPGTYVIRLVVNDGKADSAPDEMVISTENSKPLAEAGPDQTALVGATVTLDGSRSNDVDGDPLTLTWTLMTVPSGSTAQLSDPGAVKPTFTIDKPGTYVVQLVVNDGTLDSDPDTVTILTENSKPVANAGPDQTTHVGDTVTLDGSKSSDVDGNPLTFKWALIGQPAGSAAQLSSPAAVKPELSIDKPGTYVAQLTVNDGTVDSDPDTVTIITENSKPVANAGPDQTAHVGDTVTLDGSKSSDVDGDLLTHKWSLTIVPAGSGATLSDPAAVKPQFSIDKPGTYVAQLIVNDGQLDSTPDTVTIITENSKPVANAGPAQTVRVGDTVSLDGRGSSDVDGDPLTFKWSLTAVPAGSAAALSDPAAQQPTFFVDKPGTYVVQLIVNDGAMDSAPATVTISTVNSKPVAEAGPDQTVYVHETVTLDGTGSLDADFDPLTYLWSFTTRPAGSSAALSSTTVPQPSFDADREGTYVAQLIVNDGKESSTPDTVTITANVRMITVPGVVGMTQANAEAAILAAKLVVGTVTTANSSTVPAGSVISQNPAAAASVPEGSGVALVVSLGPAMVTVPNVVGMTQANAEAAILAAKLVVGTVTTANSSTVPAGSVISQNPTAAASVPEGSAVDLIVSLGEVNGSPTIISTPTNTATVGEPYNYDVQATDPNPGDSLTFSLTVAPSGMTIDPSSGLIQWTPAESQVGTVYVTVKVTDPGLLSDSQAFPVTVSPQGVPGDLLRPEVSVTINPAVAYVGEPVTITVTAADNVGVVSRSLTVNGTPLSLDASGIAIFSSTTAGIFTAIGTAVDAEGNEGQGSQEFRILISGSTAAPVAFITSPADNAVIASPTDIIGTASDSNLMGFRLEYSIKDRNEFTTFASGTASVTNGVLGRLDPSLMRNGLYDIRLTVEDTSGTTVSTTRVYQLKGEAKVGNFSISYNDLVIPISGVSITITRTYDSRVKEKEDFGVGWALALNTADIQENRVPGEGWEVYCTRSIYGYCIEWGVRQTSSHTIVVTLPGMQEQEFEVRTSTNYADTSGIAQGTISFSPKAGTYSRLEALDNTTYDFLLGNELLDNSLSVINPGRYRLTGADGTVYTISQSFGLESIKETNGGTVTFTLNGIIHSAGQSVNFNRDAQGRITAITDPKGETIHYQYDFYGDLVSVTDRENNSTKFRYGSTHNLIDIIDPRGIPVARNEYDDDGRLISTTDASGKVIQFEHDLVNNREVYRDRLGYTKVFEYDANGNITKSVDALGNTTLSEYDASGKLIRETDAAGNVRSMTYNASGALLTETDALGYVKRYTYNAGGSPLTEQDGDGGTKTYAYDAGGNLQSETDPVGNITSYTRNAAGNALTTTDPRGFVTTRTFTPQGREASVADPAGNTVSYSYDVNGNLTNESRVRTVNGSPVTETVTYAYDGEGRLISRTDPNGHTIRTEYNAVGLPAAQIDRLGQRKEMYYNFQGKVSEISYPDGTIISFEYDAEGRKTAATDREGRHTQFTLDAAGRVLTTTHPDGATESKTYDALGRVATEIDGNGNSKRYAYDALGRVVTIQNALGETTTFTYDARGNKLSQTDAAGRTTQYVYDGNNCPLKTIYPDGTTVLMAYDGNGNKVSETDQAGNRTLFEYDAVNRLIKVTDPLGGETRYAYDQAGNRTSITDANGQTTRFEYDSEGREVRRTLPLGETWRTEYDAEGNVVSKTDANGAVLTFQYDADNRLVRKDLPDGSVVSFTYTASGKVATESDARGVTSYTYDSRDRILRRDDPDGLFAAYTYDLAGNLLSLETPSGTTQYAYDSLNRLQRATDPDGGVTRYTYDTAGNVSTVTYPNSSHARYTYDSLNRLVRLENLRSDGTVISSYQYTLGPTGNRLRVIEDTGRRVDYTYDALYRLVREETTVAAGTVSSIDYTYDGVGNRLTKMVDGSLAVTYGYDANNRLLSEGAVLYTYDANGNVLNKTDGAVTRYGYDGENRLISVNGPFCNTFYAYDVKGNRVVSTIDGVTTRFLVDSNRTNAEVLEERDAALALQTRYVYGGDLISQAQAGHTSFYHYDGLGSVRVLTDNTETVTDTYTYEAFGNLTASSGSTPNRYLFTGEQYDPNVGFYYLRARYYNPKIGRFLTQDVFPPDLFDPATLHRYAYVANNPVNRVDPSGQQYTLAGLMMAVSISDILMAIQPTIIQGAIIYAGIELFWRPGFELRNKALMAIMKGPPNEEGWEAAYRMYRNGNKLIELGAFFIQTASDIHDILQFGLGVASLARAYQSVPRATLTSVEILSITRYSSVAFRVETNGVRLLFQAHSYSNITMVRTMTQQFADWSRVIYESVSLLAQLPNFM